MEQPNLGRAEENHPLPRSRRWPDCSTRLLIDELRTDAVRSRALAILASVEYPAFTVSRAMRSCRYPRVSLSAALRLISVTVASWIWIYLSRPERYKIEPLRATSLKRPRASAMWT
jgi:hypothetical protein